MSVLDQIKSFFESTLIGFDAGHIFCQIITVLLITSLIWLVFIYRKRAFPPKSLMKSLRPLNKETPSHEVLSTLNGTDERWHVLRNFTESLIEATEDGDNVVHRRTQPTSNQINPESVNPRLFKGYFLVWIPSVLTTLGVLGTFVGLQIGLGGINLEGDVTEMLGGMRVLIDGAKTAFNTSIFGVASGIVFGLSLRIVRQHERNQLQALANRLDELIPEASPEDDLRHVRTSSAQTTEQMKALREEVGPKLQETLQGMPTLIGTAVAKEIQEAVGQIGQQNAESLGDALQKVYSEHLGDLAGLGKTITAQVEITQQILTKLEKLAPALETSAAHLDSSSKSLESVSTQFGTWDDALKSYSVTLSTTTDAFTSATTTLNTASKLIEGSIPGLQEAIGTASQATQENQSAITENSKGLIDSFGSVQESLKGFETAVGSMQELAPSLTKTASTLVSFVDSLEASSVAQHENAKSNKDAAEKFAEVAGHFESASSHLGALGDVAGNLSQAGSAAKEGFTQLHTVTGQLELLEKSLKSIAASFDLVRDEELGEQFTSAASALKDASQKLVHLTNAGENLERAGNTAVQLFSQAGTEHTTFIEGLTTGVAALKEEIASLLETYRNSMAEQTQQRIQDWNTEATNFGVTFRKKVDDLSGSIEDLQESLAANRR